MDNFENTSEIAREHLRLLVYHMQGKILYIGQLSRSCCRINRLAICHLKPAIVVHVAQGKPAKIVSKKQQVQFIQSIFFTNKPKVI